MMDFLGEIERVALSPVAIVGLSACVRVCVCVYASSLYNTKTV